MKNQECIVCGKEFPPRKGKLFCSDKCKQLHYRSKDDPELISNKIVEKFKQTGQLDKLDVGFLKKIFLLEKKPLFRIDLNEYKAYCEKYGKIELDEYVIRRKNLTGVVSLEQIEEYIKLSNDSNAFCINYCDETRYEWNQNLALIASGLIEFYYGDQYKNRKAK